MLHMRQ